MTTELPVPRPFKSTDPITKDEENRDFNVVRQNLHELIIKGNWAVDEVTKLADQSQSPRFYEVLAQLLRTTVDANRELMDTHKKRKDMRHGDSPTTVVNQNKNLIIASTAEVLEMVKKNLIDQPQQIEAKNDFFTPRDN